MALFEIIKKEKDDENIVWKYPKTDFNTSSQLIVHESQEAILYKDGKALDLFGSGRYTLETNNIPLLRNLINLPTGGKSPFHCEVYFIDKSIKSSRWGTSSKIEFLEPTYKFPIQIGACGEMRFKVVDSRKLLLKLVGIKDNFDGENIDEFFSSFILVKVKSYIAKIINKNEISIFEIDSHLNEFSEELKNLLASDFEEFGIELENFFVTTVMKPEDDRQYLEFKELYFKQSVAVAEAQLRQKVTLIDEETKAKSIMIDSEAKAHKRETEGYSYQDERQYNVLDKMASNNAVGQFTNMGVGLGVMSSVSSKVSDTVNKNVVGAFAKNDNSTICSNCGYENASGIKFCIKCGNNMTGSVCSSCGKKLPNDAAFCPYCGKKVGE